MVPNERLRGTYEIATGNALKLRKNNAIYVYHYVYSMLVSSEIMKKLKAY